MHKNNSFPSSLRNAFNGLISLVRHEKNARYHLAATFLVILLASFLHLSIVDWALLLGVIFLVWIAELFNTTLEYLYDFVKPDFDPIVKMGKDMSAAAVLLTAALSVIVGLLILGPALLRVLDLIPG
jgi:diacylglycerol kinase